MNFSQKRTCGECRALRVEFWKCDLGIPIKPSRWVEGIVVNFEPLKPCYKPLTNKDYVELSLEKTKK